MSATRDYFGAEHPSVGIGEQVLQHEPGHAEQAYREIDSPTSVQLAGHLHQQLEHPQVSLKPCFLNSVFLFVDLW